MHKVQLIHVTPEAEQLVAYMARVSNPSNQGVLPQEGSPQDNPEATGLIRYLIKHKHWSPFEMVNMCVSIETTRSIAAQILRHRSFSFQEFSQRYAPVTAKPAELAVRRQDTKNRQNSIDNMPYETAREFKDKASMVYDLSYKLYEEMLAAGVAKECAREVLPLSSPTKLYMNGTIRSWLHYCDLRCDNGTQYEHKMIADQVKAVLASVVPSIHDAMWQKRELS